MRNKYSNLKKVSHKSGEAQSPATNLQITYFINVYLIGFTAFTFTLATAFSTALAIS